MDEEKANEPRSDISPAERNRLIVDRRGIPLEYPERLALNDYILSVGYAMGVVVLCFGMVILTITLAVLCFMYPDKANAFLVLLASPIVVLVVTNSVKIAKVIRERAVEKREIEDKEMR